MMGRLLHCASRYQPYFHSSLGNKCYFICAQTVFLNYSDGCRGGNGNESSGKKKLSQIRSGNNPFDVLGVSKVATYTEAKQRFLELALKYHPDHATKRECGDEGNSTRTDDFIRFRQAFESLKEDMNGNVTQVDEGESTWSDEEFNAWYHEETGHSDLMFRMDMKTRREVIDVVNEQAQGGLDRGGMWEMARKMAEEERFLKENKNKIERKVGLEQQSASNSSLQRRRRKKR
jgi:hypothetical protein